ncbi:hypothetical protein ACQUWN_12495 [Rossellomorea aquimaris]|uniref:hypothetical protein n=1 Tax=Rossellomorea TaxID=2837508 RepID=UPI0016534AD2|nr:hypothetical protein [Rossellomorea vietnamensis]
MKNGQSTVDKLNGPQAAIASRKPTMRANIKRKRQTQWPASRRCGPLSSGKGRLNGP